MIVVVADDITGAAEMAGVALRYGLKTIVSNDVNADHDVDVLVIYTNTRSMSKEEAAGLMEDLTGKAMQLQPLLFYKKTDSVLRGHILSEMKMQMKAMQVDKGLLVPANPLLGRMIRNGKYYVNGELIHQTGFSHDPEFPVKTSDVIEMLEKEDVPVKLVSKNEPLPEKGISIGEAATDEDIKEWAACNDGQILLAGGASFFNALLAEKYSVKEEKRQVQLSLPAVLISGTTFQENVQRIKAYPDLVSYMPLTIFLNDRPDDSEYEEWLDAVVRILSKHNKAIVAVDNSGGKNADPDLLREKKARIAKLILEKVKIRELLIEGGSTAYSIIKKINRQSFTPAAELRQGIVRMQVNGAGDLHLTIKPGSYDWPAEWNFN